MIAFLPLPGGFASLANRVLSPSIGFGVGWIYFFRQVNNASDFDCSIMLQLPNKLVAAANYMTFWTYSVHPAVWIVIYVIPPIIFNLFNVRRYGEIEFWLTLQKVFTFVLLIGYGILMAMQASAITPWSGTNSKYEAVPCSVTANNIPCVGSPGFNRTRL
jgi:amino acid permease